MPTPSKLVALSVLALVAAHAACDTENGGPEPPEGSPVVKVDSGFVDCTVQGQALPNDTGDPLKVWVKGWDMCPGNGDGGEHSRLELTENLTSKVVKLTVIPDGGSQQWVVSVPDGHSIWLICRGRSQEENDRCKWKTTFVLPSN